METLSPPRLMKSVTSLLAVAVFWGSASVWAQSEPGEPRAVRPVYTNKTRFRIPYNFDPAEMRRLNAKEILLYGSLDRGATWQKIQSVAPDAGRFGFEAPADGEYWFSVKTLDGQGGLHPDGEIEPGLAVIVDSTPPKLELTLIQTAAGRVQLAWNGIDEHLDPTKLRLEFAQPGIDGWQMVGVIPKAADQTEWSVPSGGIVAVRGTIADLAGNVGQHQVQAQIQPGNGPVPAVPNHREPVAGNSANSATTTFAPPPDAGAGNLISLRQGQFPSAIQSPAQTLQRAPALPPGFAGRIRVVGTRRFQIGYRVQDVGPSGISAVEIYRTTDQGATWQKASEDLDRQSPADIEVPQEGTYGFTLLVKSGVGLAADPPLAGDTPGIVVVVDETAPAIELLPVEQGRGPSSNKLLIQWRTRETFPAEKPVSLYFAAEKLGPWQPIAAGLDDAGGYIWTLPAGMTARFYVRIETRDAAGNVGRAESLDPVLFDPSKPTAKIIDVEIGTPR